jgi:hypothetical protein
MTMRYQHLTLEHLTPEHLKDAMGFRLKRHYYGTGRKNGNQDRY